jgi:curved DNA-binding protein CbpA
MKDYYYILGVTKDSSNVEIKKAYRKLSLKFHPDRNDGDVFFEERFKEIQEAYELLSDLDKRKKYDELHSNKNSYSNDNKNYIPVIEYFKCDSTGFEYDKEITFTWKCLNSDICELKPFGIVSSIGLKTVKLKNFENPYLTFELIATNNYLQKRISSKLTLQNITFKHLKEKILQDHKQAEVSNKNQKSKNNNLEETDNGVFGLTGMWIFISVIVFIVFIILIKK